MFHTLMLLKLHQIYLISSLRTGCKAEVIITVMIDRVTMLAYRVLLVGVRLGKPDWGFIVVWTRLL